MTRTTSNMPLLVVSLSSYGFCFPLSSGTKMLSKLWMMNDDYNFLSKDLNLTYSPFLGITFSLFTINFKASFNTIL